MSKKIKEKIKRNQFVVNYSRMWPFVKPIWPIALLSLLMISFAVLPTASAQRYMTWTVSATLRYNRHCFEQQNLESKLYGIIYGEVQSTELLVSARNREEAEKFGYEAALKVAGGMKSMYEGIGEYNGKPCHVYIFAEVESLTVESNPIDPMGEVPLF